MKIRMLLTTLIFATLLSTSLVSANLYVKPAKLGVWRLELFPFSTATVNDEFAVGNTYDFPITIKLYPNGNVTNMTTLSTDYMILLPNETRTINYTINLDKPGIYLGGVSIEATAENKTTNIVYSADITIYVNNSDNGYLVIMLPILAIVLVAAFLIYKKKRKGKK